MNINEQFSALPKEDLPKHIAIIPNGNRTWARKKGLPNTEGHNVGVEVLLDFTRNCRKWGIHTATVWGSSTENLKKRDPTEVANLIRLLKYVMETTLSEAREFGARIIHLGNKSLLPKEIVKQIIKIEEETRSYKNYVANIAFAYGGHDEIFRALQAVFQDINDGKITFEELMQEDGLYQNKYPYHFFKRYLDTKDQPYPYPDLIIRTAGEYRLSGFMPWQSVYSEFYSTPVLLPEFTDQDLKKAIISYATRDRSFGGQKTKQ